MMYNSNYKYINDLWKVQYFNANDVTIISKLTSGFAITINVEISNTFDRMLAIVAIPIRSG